MGNKKKLAQFAELRTFDNVLEVGYSEVLESDHRLKGKWASEVFKNERAIVLELGCGKGEYTVGMARMYPEKNFIGMDIKGARIWRGAKTSVEDDLNNARFLRSRIDFITSFFEKGEVDEIWLTFPDPQAQSSRERKRLTSDRFLDRFREVLVPGGFIHLKTDSDFLYQYSLDKARERGMVIHMHSGDVYGELDKLDLTEKERSILRIKTFYEKMFTEKGHSISYIRMSHE